MNDVIKELQEIYSKFRDAEKLVIPELSSAYTNEDVKRMDKAFTDYYHEIDDIRSMIGLILDKLQKPNYE